MNVRTFSQAIGQLDEAYYEEAANFQAQRHRRAWVKWGAAACLCLAVLAAAAALLNFSGGVTVTAYAYESDQALTSSAAFTTGSIDDNGVLTGHPLLFRLSGENIEAVRFSCKNGQMDLINLGASEEQYSAAQNFTVDYSVCDGAYSSLLIDWLPSHLIALLQEDGIAIASLPEELLEDIIVMEVSFANGRTATYAITVSLLPDGSFSASFDRYTIRSADTFVDRPDSQPDSVASVDGDLTVTFYDGSGNAVEPEGNWYETSGVAYIGVQLNGEAPEQVQMLFTPTGTETSELMEFLDASVTAEAHEIILSAASLHRISLMGYLKFVIRSNGCTFQSGTYNVIYCPEA